MASNCPRCSQRGQGYAAFFNTDWLILRYQWGVSVYIISVNGMAVMCNLGNINDFGQFSQLSTGYMGRKC